MCMVLNQKLWENIPLICKTAFLSLRNSWSWLAFLSDVQKLHIEIGEILPTVPKVRPAGKSYVSIKILTETSTYVLLLVGVAASWPVISEYHLKQLFEMGEDRNQVNHTGTTLTPKIPPSLDNPP